MLAGAAVLQKSRQFFAPENLGEMQSLALVHHIPKGIRVKEFAALDHGSQVGGGIDVGIVGFFDNDRRHGSGVLLVGDLYHFGTVAFLQQTLALQNFKQSVHIVLGIGFPVPVFKAHIQAVVDFFHIGFGNGHKGLPERIEAGVLLLQTHRGLVCGGGEGCIRFAFCGGAGVHFVQFFNGNGRNGFLFGVKIGGKAGPIRVALLQFGDDESHLQAPVSQVNISDGVRSCGFGDPLDRFSDDRRAKMSDVQGLGHIGSSVVHQHGLSFQRLGDSFVFIPMGLIDEFRKPPAVQGQIDETGHGHFRLFKGRHPLQFFHHGGGNFEGGHFIELGTLHGAVALKLTDVRAVRFGDCAEFFRVSAGGKGLSAESTQGFEDCLHVVLFLIFCIHTSSGRMLAMLSICPF